MASRPIGSARLLMLAVAVAAAVGAAAWKVEHWHCVSYRSPDMTAEHAVCDTWISLPRYARNWWVLDIRSGAALRARVRNWRRP
jgi:hypothetical protein